MIKLTKCLSIGINGSRCGSNSSNSGITNMLSTRRTVLLPSTSTAVSLPNAEPKLQQQRQQQHQFLSIQNRHLITSSIFSPNVLVPYTSTYDNTLVGQQQQQQQQVQVRNHWTKAKKKRYARYNKRQEMAAAGIPVPNPPSYIPRDVKIVNAFTKEERAQESKDHDESASEGLKEKLLNLKDKQDTLLRHHMSVVTTGSGKHVIMSDRVRQLFSLHNGNQHEVIAAQKKLGMELFQIREGDTGSTAVQIIALTTRIQQLQTHMNKHKKDKHSKRGMDALFVRRRKLLDYMERKQFPIYRKVVKTLGLVR